MTMQARAVEQLFSPERKLVRNKPASSIKNSNGIQATSVRKQLFTATSVYGKSPRTGPRRKAKKGLLHSTPRNKKKTTESIVKQKSRPAWNEYLTDGEKYKLPKAQAVASKLMRVSKNRLHSTSPATGRSRHGAINILSPSENCVPNHDAKKNSTDIVETPDGYENRAFELLGENVDAEGVERDETAATPAVTEAQIHAAEDMLAETLNLKTPGRSFSQVLDAAAPPSAPNKMNGIRRRMQKHSSSRNYRTSTSSESTSQQPTWCITTKYNVDTPENRDLRSRLFLDSVDDKKRSTLAPDPPRKLKAQVRRSVNESDTIFADDFEEPADDQINMITGTSTIAVTPKKKSTKRHVKSQPLEDVVDELVGKLSEMDAMVEQERTRRLDLEMRLMHAEFRLNRSESMEKEDVTCEETSCSEVDSGGRLLNGEVDATHIQDLSRECAVPSGVHHKELSPANVTLIESNNDTVVSCDGKDNYSSFIEAEARAAADAIGHERRDILTTGSDSPGEGTIVESSVRSFVGKSMGEDVYKGTGSVDEWIDQQLANALMMSSDASDAAASEVAMPDNKGLEAKSVKSNNNNNNNKKKKMAVGSRIDQGHTHIVGEWLAPAES